jgi:hypothetical protein
MLDALFAETKRLVREKAPAVHAVANALLERQELIGEELDEIYAMVEEAHPEIKAVFERTLLVLQKPFEDRDWRKAETVPIPAEIPAAATEPPVVPKPAAPAPWSHWPTE